MIGMIMPIWFNSYDSLVNTEFVKEILKNSEIILTNMVILKILTILTITEILSDTLSLVLI